MKSKTLFTKVVSMLLCTLMVVGCLPLAALADDGLILPDNAVCDHPADQIEKTAATCQNRGSEVCTVCGEELSWEAQIEHDAGTCELCAIQLLKDQDTALKAGTLYYAVANAGDVIATFEGVVSVKHNEITYTADENASVVIDTIVSNEQGLAYFIVEVAAPAEGETLNANVSFDYPIGHIANVAELVLGTNTATVGNEAFDFYNYTWTATCNGTLTVTMTGSDWNYTLNNNTANKYGTTHFSDGYESSDGTITASETIAVSTGDVVALNVNTNMATAGTITFTAEFEHTAGCIDNPIILGAGQENALSAGTYYYAAYNVNSMIATVTGATSVEYNGETYEPVEGVITIEGLTTSYGTPAVLQIAVEEAATVSFSLPLGHLNNPAELVIGGNTATVGAEAFDFYNYTWTATSDGNLTITMTSHDWNYSISNATTGATTATHYSDGYDSDDGTITASETIAVSAGDVIKVNVNTNMATAGTITFTASFEEASTCDHTVIYTDNGDGTHSGACECGEVVVTNVVHAYEDGFCVCLANEPIPDTVNIKMATYNVNFESKLMVNWLFEKSVVTNATDYYVEFVKTAGVLGEDVVITVSKDEMTENGSRLMAIYPQVISCEMGLAIQTKLYAKIGGTWYCSQTYAKSVKDYAVSQLNKAITAGNNDYARLLVETLNYGAATQTFFGYMTDSLVNGDLTADQLAYGYQEDPTCSKTYDMNGNGGEVTWKSVDMNMMEKINFIIKFDTTGLTSASSVDNLTAVLYDTDGVTVLETVNMFTLDSGKIYTLELASIPPADLRTMFSVVLYADYGTENQTAVSSIFNVSLEAYPYLTLKNASNTAEKKALAICILKYGDAANAYFA